jgi:hypothetical protein
VPGPGVFAEATATGEEAMAAGQVAGCAYSPWSVVSIKALAGSRFQGPQFSGEHRDCFWYPSGVHELLGYVT